MLSIFSEIISQFKANIPRVCVVWKSNKKANIGKYFILGIQGTIDIVTTWTWLTLTHAWGSVQCLLISFPQPLQSPHHASIKAWRYHGHQQRWTGSVQNQSCVQIIQSLCQGITNNILSISGLWELFSLPRCNYPDGGRGVVRNQAFRGQLLCSISRSNSLYTNTMQWIHIHR